MPRRARYPLEKKGREVTFYVGDWDELTELLAPRKIKPSTFIREVIANILKRAREATNQPIQTEISLDDLQETEST